MVGMDVSDGPVEVEPRGFVSRDEQCRVLLESLAGLELGVWDERIVSWLAGWEWSTVSTIASWLQRVNSQPAAGSCQG
jgi:hypothetical protein